MLGKGIATCCKILVKCSKPTISRSHIRLFHCLKRFHSATMSSEEKGADESVGKMEIEEQAAKTEGQPSKEGKAEVFLPTSVFYNPVQEFNRDLTIAVISQHARDHFKKIRQKEKPATDPQTEDNDDVNVKVIEPLEDLGIEAGKKYDDGIRVLEGLGASGLRSVRFGLEIPGLKEVVCNDFSKSAVEFIEKNVAHNKVEHLVRAHHGDAAMVMYEHRAPEKRFDVIDIDPYGSPAMFLDAAVQAVRDGGLLCVTCTDMAILCGNNPETCYAKYGAVPLRAKFCHEMALRIVLHAIEQHATCYARYIEPLVCVSADFYCRVFVRVHTSPKKVKDSLTRQALVYQCTGCSVFSLQQLGVKVPTKGGNHMVNVCRGPPVGPRCEHCGHSHHVGGPMWSAPIHNAPFVERVIRAVQRGRERFGTAERIIGMLSVVQEELGDAPLYYHSDGLCSVLHSLPLKMQVWRSAILNAGYRVSSSHAAKNSIKTDAPNNVIWDILRCWIKEHPIQEKHLKDGTPVKAILSQPPQIQACFDIHPDSNPKSRENGLLRFQHNPQKNWGPAARASKNQTSLEERRRKGEERAAEKRHKDKDKNFKQFPCKRRKVGQCDKGEDCLYSHDIAEEESQDAQTDATTESTETEKNGAQENMEVNA